MLKPSLTEDTIVAISTPPGEGGIGIVRISGPQAFHIADRVFQSPRGISPSLASSHRLYYGFIIDPSSGEKIDEVLLSVMKAPHTYTREDVIEINCHGGYVVLKRVLEIVIRAGARLAMPGEFTMRAFLNGRIDLTQAEAVLDLIRAKTEEAERIALGQITGGLRLEIERLSGKLQDIVAEIEAYIDFPEEDIFTEGVNWTDKIKEVEERLRGLSDSFYQGRILREGLATVIAGRPNVGKSSLLNSLLGMERSIVTEIPGTTRDIIEEVINIRGIPLRLIDTAGIREAKDIVEAEGIRRTEAAIEKAELVLLVIDGSQALTSFDIALLDSLKRKGIKIIVLLNKKDLGLVIRKDAPEFMGLPVVEISCLKKEGLEDLKELIFTIFVSRPGLETPSGILITRVRHKVHLDEALLLIQEALELMAQKVETLEIVAFNLRKALMGLNEIIGLEFSEEALLERIFSEFCIGK